MTAARHHRRSGITLTEILIAILIMGVGLISLATLFPLGLLRLREGTRQGRSGTTFETAADDMDARKLMIKASFINTYYGVRDPFTQDVLANGTYNVNNTTTGVLASGSYLFNNNVGLQTGLPICYDPLWRAITGVAPPHMNPLPNTTTLAYDPTLDVQAGYFAFGPAEARFGSALFNGTPLYIQPTDTDGGVPSAHGLQRLTNFIPWSSAGLTSQYAFTTTNPSAGFNPPTFLYQPPDVAGNVFTSVDDVVFNPAEGGINIPSAITKAVSPASPLLPDMSVNGVPQADYRFTWFFTGHQLDNSNGKQFIGQVVVCDGRPFGFDVLPGSTAYSPAGETVVEAIYGYGGNARAVLLRWNDSLADPQIRVGGWIADTTYERNTTVYKSRVLNSVTSFARCNWYQIAKRVDPGPDSIAGYRSTVVTLTSPVQTLTTTHMNVALIMPSVINVFPRSFEVR